MLTTKYKGLLQAYEKYQKELFEQLTPDGLYEPVRYLLYQSGKRIRPVLALMTSEGLQGDHRPALPVAAALEVFHNFTLMHDDIMDEAPKRRGMPTVHQKYNLAQAILSGDVMLIWAYRILSDTAVSPEDKLYLMERFSEVATQICEGQQRDMEFEEREVVTVAEYIRMIEQKTAVLLGASLELGALSAGFDRAYAHELYEFGRLLGISFQMQDDWLDAFGDPDQTGKAPGGDIARKKKTIVYLEGLRLWNDPVRNSISEIYNRDEKVRQDEVEWILGQLTGVGVDKLVGAKIQQTMDEALKHLDLASLPEGLVNDLKALAGDLVKRSY